MDIVNVGGVRGERYGPRWTGWEVEALCQRQEQHLKLEIAGVGYPQASLFGFCWTLVAFNLDAMLIAVLGGANCRRFSWALFRISCVPTRSRWRTPSISPDFEMRHADRKTIRATSRNQARKPCVSAAKLLSES
jgi:hypothetical protein